MMERRIHHSLCCAVLVDQAKENGNHVLCSLYLVSIARSVVSLLLSIGVDGTALTWDSSPEIK